jgi:hypothetical protein
VANVNSTRCLSTLAGAGTDVAGVEKAIMECIGGHQGRERHRSLSFYGPRLGEIVVRRDKIREKVDGVAVGPEEVVRLATFPSWAIPSWCRWFAEEHDRLKGTPSDGACPKCRRVLKNFFIAWLHMGAAE